MGGCSEHPGTVLSRSNLAAGLPRRSGCSSGPKRFAQSSPSASTTAPPQPPMTAVRQTQLRGPYLAELLGQRLDARARYKVTCAPRARRRHAPASLRARRLRCTAAAVAGAGLARPGTIDLHRASRPSRLSAWCAGHFGQVDPGLDAELVEDVAQVSVHGMRRYEQRLGNFAVRFSFRG